MTSDTPLDLRLRRMVDEDANGAEAAQLLRYLTVLETPFDGTAAVVMAPGRMLELEVRRALRTLIRWQFVVEEGADRYSVPSDVMAHLPPDKQMHALHLARYAFRMTFPIPNEKQIVQQWANICAAFAWGMDHDQRRASDFFISITDVVRKRIDPQQALTLAAQFLTAAERDDDLYQQALLWEQIGDLLKKLDLPPSAESATARALLLYEAYAHQLPHVGPDLLWTMARLAHAQKAYDKAQSYYETVIRLFRQDHNRSSRVREFEALHDLIKLAFARSSPDKAQHYFQVQNQLGVSRWELSGKMDPDDSNSLRVFGMIAGEYGFMGIARDAFARTLLENEARLQAALEWNARQTSWREIQISYSLWDQAKTLWVWGRAEYHNNHRETGCRLCLLAILRDEDERRPSDTLPSFFRRDYQIMMCSDEPDAN